MQSTSMILFLVFALVLAFSYIGIRRQWAAPAAISAACVVISFVLMMLISLAQRNSVYQAIIVGLIVGGLCSGGILGMAWYFQANERRQAGTEAVPLPEDESLSDS
jgi:Na+/H+-translocating membrane pyrophosphatase